MINRLHDVLGLWINVVVGQVAVRKPQSIHVDELLRTGVDQSNWLKMSVDAFALLVEQIKILQSSVQPLLVIPLVSHSNELTRGVPASLDMVEKQVHDLEPPSLHLLDRRAWAMREIVEEYKVPLAFSFPGDKTGDIYGYYREYRYREGMLYDEEYYRSVYFAYYPAEFQSGHE